MSSKKGHSEDYFGEYRNFWWNKGFLDLVAKRLELQQYHSLLDVGCGMCHWSRALFPYLGQPAHITGVDTDMKWIYGNEESAAFFAEHGAEFDLYKGDAQKLPFEDDTFDVVTCQTVLIHVRNPDKAIEEMKRVLRPGGTLLCVEPNNLIQSLTKSSLSAEDTVDEVLDHVKYALICERGKKKLGKGDNSLGDLLPGMFAEAGLHDVNVCLSDKAIPMYPPYNRDEQIATMEQWTNPEAENPDLNTDYDYFLAFGDKYLDFYNEYHRKYSSSGKEILRSVRAQEYHSAGGAIMYLVSGVK
ncbi:MAG: methyltransferase domain-containing protein [Hymenobacteraceae bacterium]|nr:methyltransferase domain-containing protein [Hymenobacteraceae bacterium]MDX5396262.1 methyltransferase domain-containing protein [Hymenobacteraceae bacterium]MDX5444230.1 methyltransferase domain-containing protein [Hymenobacteraceae bacterium]MDX5512325.1 methyltransferase domain-containing protein [Hymenobacteraceae bacterium]